MKRIGSKLFAGFLCMAVLTVGLLWLIQAVVMKDNYLNERIRTIHSAIKSASENTAIDYQALESELNVSLLLVDYNGNIVYMSQGMPMRGMMIRQIPNIMKQNENGQVQYLNTASKDVQYAILGHTLTGGGNLYAVFSLVDVENASRILLEQLWIITAVLFAFSILLAILLARMFSRPIRRVTQAAREMASGKLDIHLPVCSKDEVGQLTVALNELGIELKKTENLRHELIANVSHELRSPLTVIQGFAETVRDVTWPDQEKRSSQLTMISDEASRLSKIVSDILDYSRLQSGVDQITISDFPVCSRLSEVMDHYELEAHKKNLSLHLDCTDLTVRFDQNRFSQVLNNLLNNAINHAEIGSSVFVKVEAKGNEARISVQNSGKTIPVEDLSYIWDRFYQVEQINDHKPLGTGLGLSIVKSIFDVHGVSYGVHSENDLTVFWFDTLPLMKDSF